MNESMPSTSPCKGKRNRLEVSIPRMGKQRSFVWSSKAGSYQCTCKTHRRKHGACRPHGSWHLAIATLSRHSWRNATSGSMRVARRAGMYVASSAAAPSTNGTTAYVAGSYGFTPYSSFSMKRATSAAPARPATAPASVCAMPCLSTSASTSAREAPSEGCPCDPRRA